MKIILKWERNLLYRAAESESRPLRDPRGQALVRDSDSEAICEIWAEEVAAPGTADAVVI